MSTVLRLRTDETDRLLEPVLATAVSRRRVLAVQLAWCFGGSAALLLAAGAATDLAATATLTGSPPELGAAQARAAAEIPPVWVVGAVAALIVGTWPRWSPTAWVVLGGCVLLTEVGPLLGLPQAVLDVSPFTAVPPTAGDVPVVPLVVLTVVAAGLTAAAATAFQRRDIG